MSLEEPRLDSKGRLCFQTIGKGKYLLGNYQTPVFLIINIRYPVTILKFRAESAAKSQWALRRMDDPSCFARLSLCHCGTNSVIYTVCLQQRQAFGDVIAHDEAVRVRLALETSFIQHADMTYHLQTLV